MNIELQTALLGIVATISVTGIPIITTWAYKMNGRLISIETKLSAALKADIPRVVNDVVKNRADIDVLKVQVQDLMHGGE